ncbi:MAG: monodechloroaminopyrrolnitrin synthase PrnB family protein [Chitinophagales bacterium]
MIKYSADLHLRVSVLDPLGFDPYVDMLHDLNQKENLKGLIELTSDLLPSLKFIQSLDVENNLAAMRDLGFLISSIRKLGVQPVKVVSNLETILLQIAKNTALPPRESSYHYGVWNPAGSRQRTFTKLEDEIGLINGVRNTIPYFENIAFDIFKLLETDNSDFSMLLSNIESNFEKSVSAFAQSMRLIDPWVFSNRLRPYFDPVEVGNKEYIGPGGGQIPLYLVDKMLWFDNDDEIYLKFTRECNAYMPIYLREMFDEIEDKPSLLKKVSTALTDHSNTVDGKCLEQIDNVFKLLYKFRKPHTSLARKSLSKENRGNYETGSAGYKFSFVEHVLRLNIEKYESFKNQFS